MFGLQFFYKSGSPTAIGFHKKLRATERFMNNAFLYYSMFFYLYVFIHTITYPDLLSHGQPIPHENKVYIFLFASSLRFF